MFLSKIGKWLFAIILIFFGVILFLQNLNIISLEISEAVWDSWPVILIVVGLVSLIKFFSPRESGSWQFGSFLIIFGSLLWAGNFQLIDFSFIDIWKLWPLILIYLGTNMLFGKSSIIITYEHDTDKSDKKKFKNGEIDFDDFDIFDEKIDGSYKSKKKGTYNYHFKTKNKFVTDMNFSNNNWEVQPMDLWTGVGDLYFDFSKAYIPYKETHIKLRGYVADIQMRLPDHIAYKIYAKVNIGEVRLFEESRSGFNNVIEFKSADYDTATRKLNIEMNYQVGEITVLSV